VLFAGMTLQADRQVILYQIHAAFGPV
jgi:hypothetical protein